MNYPEKQNLELPPCGNDIDESLGKSVDCTDGTYAASVWEHHVP